MAAVALYEGAMVAATIATAIGSLSAANLLFVPSSNGQQCIIVNCKG